MRKLTFFLFFCFFSTSFAESIPAADSPWELEYTENTGLTIKENGRTLLVRQPEDVGFFLKAHTIEWNSKKFLLTTWEAGQAMHYELLDPNCKKKPVVTTGRSIGLLETHTNKKSILITYTTTTDDDVGMMLSPVIEVTRKITPRCPAK